LAGILLAFSLIAASAAGAADLPIPPRQAPPAVPAYKAPALVEFKRFYVGAAVNWTHHTGYVPHTVWSAEWYTFGGKAFGGFRFTDWASFEVAYHHLGRARFNEGLPTPSHEQSYALSGSVVFTFPPISNLIGPTHVPIHAFLRFGLAYKHITHEAFDGTYQEGILSGVFGAGWEYRLPKDFFVRLEYEFLSTAIGGPPQSIPALNSLFLINFGGTHRVINVMHTPLAVTLGANF
jgi:hypothetical protein